MGFREDFYPESRFGGFTDIDGTILFFTRVKALLDASSVVLDLGCRRGAYGEASNPTTVRARVLKDGFFLGVLHQRFAPGFLRTTLFAFARLRTTP